MACKVDILGVGCANNAVSTPEGGEQFVNSSRTVPEYSS